MRFPVFRMAAGGRTKRGSSGTAMSDYLLNFVRLPEERCFLSV